MISTIALGLALATPAFAGADAPHWPSFRGERARGVQTTPCPDTWDVERGEHVRWRTPIPGLAHSSPVLWGDRLFVTTAVRVGAESELSSLYGSPGYGAGESVLDEGEHAFRLYCLDAATGDVRWSRDAHVGIPKVKRHPKSTHANSTPACDAERVVAFFASEGLHCYDHDGNRLWSRDFGVLNSGAPGYPDKDGYQWGFASSPVLHDGRVIVQCDVENDSFVAVLDATTGQTIWRMAREEDSTWGTPAVHDTSVLGRPQVILNGYKHLGAYDLGTGAPLWRVDGGGDVPVPTPVVAHGLVYVTNAHGRLRPIYAINETASGSLTMDPDDSEHLAWCHPRQGVYMQTPIVVGDLLYCCSDGGILSCYDAHTGERHYKERLGAGRGGFSGSPVCAGDRLYFTGESGAIYVVKVGRTFEVVAENDMGETCMSTPAVRDGVLYIKSRGHVTAIGR